MSEYDKELQTGTEEFEEATRPQRDGRKAGEKERDDQSPDQSDEQKGDADGQTR